MKIKSEYRYPFIKPRIYVKKRRKILRAIRRHVQEVHAEKEGRSYEAGGY